MKVAFPTNNEETIAKHIGLCKKIVIYQNGEKIEVVENPILKIAKEENLLIAKAGERHLGTGRILSQSLSKKEIDLFVAAQFYSQGLKQNLEYLGIMPYEIQEKEIEKVLQMLGEKNILVSSKKNDERGKEMNARRGLGVMQGRGAQRGRGMGLGRNERRGQRLNVDLQREETADQRRGLGAKQGRGMQRGRGMGCCRGFGSL